MVQFHEYANITGYVTWPMRISKLKQDEQSYLSFLQKSSSKDDKSLKNWFFNGFGSLHAIEGTETEIRDTDFFCSLLFLFQRTTTATSLVIEFRFSEHGQDFTVYSLFA